MSQVSAKLRKLEGGYYAHWCPGCKELHPIAVEKAQANGAQWSFDGNVETPTFSPSINISWGKSERCHYFIKAGQIQFCGDSTHALAGTTVPLPDLPGEA